MIINKFELNENLLELKEFSTYVRRELHKIPELSGKETKTTKFSRFSLFT